MKTQTIQSDSLQTKSAEKLLEQIFELTNSLSWLSATETLEELNAKESGQELEDAFISLLRSGSVGLIRLRQQDAAVVMGVTEYEELLRLKSLWVKYITQLKANKILQTDDRFDALFSRISSPESQAGIDRVFSATGKEIAQSYRPGDTESH